MIERRHDNEEIARLFSLVVERKVRFRVQVVCE